MPLIIYEIFSGPNESQVFGGRGTGDFFPSQPTTQEGTSKAQEKINSNINFDRYHCNICYFQK